MADYVHLITRKHMSTDECRCGYRSRSAATGTTHLELVTCPVCRPPVCEACNQPTTFVVSRRPTPDDDYSILVGPCCDPTLEAPSTPSYSPSAPCPECGHPSIAHYAIKNAPPQGQGRCGEHTGCQVCDAS